MRLSSIAVQCLLVFPSLVAAVTVSSIVARGGSTTTRTDNNSNSLGANLGHDIIKEKNAKANTATDDRYVERILQSQWEKHRRWALVAQKRKLKVETGRILKLALISVGAVAQVASTQLVKNKSTASMFGGACIAVGTYIKNQVLTEEETAKMVQSFATSQAIKTEVYKFRAQVTPYNQFKSKPDEALNLLRKRCTTISDSTKDEKFYMTRQDSRPAPGWLDTAEDYIEKRIDVMVNNVYQQRGRLLERRSAFCHNCENALLTLSAAASITSTTQLPAAIQNAVTILSGWGGAFTTISAALAHHVAKEKFSDIAVKYFEAANKLQGVKDGWPSRASMAGAPEWEKQVNKSEDIILSTLEEWAKAKTGDEDLHLEKSAPTPVPVKKEPKKMVWKPDVICGTDESGFYPASDRMQWLMDNANMTETDAQNKVMAEFPEIF
uniref:SMODS and SLOG-associating 2TM effector domain-containing protein n=1 Tax=Pseudo-nitzschia australis TaxID=44445 RepID=A0A7S4AC95_9STRA|mmetsp:Transcript_3801/g.8192  ORF Transcript_3801/g.8192 Transcript_3801/m.8192 type:complete len:438 (+) Transcript_3801:111-1424(+)